MFRNRGERLDAVPRIRAAARPQRLAGIGRREVARPLPPSIEAPEGEGAGAALLR